MMDAFRRWITGEKDPTDDAPEYGGTWIIAKGPAGCGKTTALSELAFAACLTYGLPLIAQDPAGDLSVRIKGMREHARERREKGRSKAERNAADIEYDFFSDSEKCCVYSGAETDKLIARVSKLITRARGGVRRWQAIVFIDDAGTVRAESEKFFTHQARLFRNAGMLGYLTEHREKDVPPSLRENTREILLWQGPQESIDVFDVSIPREKATPPRTNLIQVYNPSTGDFSVWDRSDKGYFPPELITPAKLSKPVLQGVMY